MIAKQLHSTALVAIESLINQALLYDPTTQQRLAKLAGKVLAIECTVPALKVYITCGQQDITLHDEWDEIPDIAIKGSAVAMVSIAIKGEEQNSLLGSGVEIRGRLDILQQLKSIFSNLDVDWEAALAKLIGDIPAHIAGKATRSLQSWRQDTHQRIGNVVSNFIKEEAQLLPTRAEMEQFSLQTRQLATDVDRLAARFHRINVTIAASADTTLQPQHEQE
jgi:ubiquinone biosynthesis protein UbiJ